MSGTANAALAVAARISRELAAAVDGADLVRILRLDAERRGLLDSARADPAGLDAEGRALLQEIRENNDRSIGALEHRLRALARDLDMAAVGARALRAYGDCAPRDR